MYLNRGKVSYYVYNFKAFGINLQNQGQNDMISNKVESNFFPPI